MIIYNDELQETVMQHSLLFVNLNFNTIPIIQGLNAYKNKSFIADTDFSFSVESSSKLIIVSFQRL